MPFRGSSGQPLAHGAEGHTTVSEVWNLALPSATSLVGGASGLGRSVTWAVTLRAAFPLFGALGKGYLALARPELARRLDSSLTPGYLISELAHAGASALAVDESISSEDVALADSLGLPVFVLPEGADLHEVERDILRTLVDRDGQLARHEIEARQSFQQALRHGGIQAVLDELSRVTLGSVLVRDQGGTTAGRSDASDGVGRSVETIFPIQVAGRSLGQLILYSDPSRHNPLDAGRARQAAEVCGIEMLERLARWETEERMGAELVQQLLDEAQDGEGTASRFLRLGYDLSPERRHVVIALGAAVDAGSGSPVSYIARDLQWAARRDGAGAVTLKHRDYWLMFCAFGGLAREQVAVTQDARNLTQRWLQQALSGVSSLESLLCCRAGVSRVVEGGAAQEGRDTIAHLRTAVRQAIDALELGQRISSFESPYYYEEMGLYRLLAGLRARDELGRFYEETLGVLVRYDGEHNTELVHTLEIFFEQNTNASQTSRVLFVHRNTLNYRLQRIAEITGLDLNEAEARLAFQLALKVHRLSM